MLIKTFSPKLIRPEPLTGWPTIGSKVRGEIRAVMYDLNMRPVLDTGWSDNLITDYGMYNLAGGGGIGSYMSIGSGSTAPTNGDTALENWAARTFAGQAGIDNPTAPLYEFGMQKFGRFDPGEATGWVREMGLHQDVVDYSNKLDVRALLSPAVDKGADNYLDVYHRLWTYPQLTPNSANLVLAFNGKTYTCSTCHYNVANTRYSQSPYNNHYTYSDSFGCYGGDGASECSPPDLLETSASWTNCVPGSNTWPTGLGLYDRGGTGPQWWADSQTYLGLDHANFTHGLTGLSTGWIPHTCQTYLKFVDALDTTKGIPKDETMRLRIRVRSTVERYVP